MTRGTAFAVASVSILLNEASYDPCHIGPLGRVSSPSFGDSMSFFSLASLRRLLHVCSNSSQCRLSRSSYYRQLPT